MIHITLLLLIISIHASREGSDLLRNSAAAYNNLFQSTLPAREATRQAPKSPGAPTISIHASREGSDACSSMTYSSGLTFQSTLPAREATDGVAYKQDNGI